MSGESSASAGGVHLRRFLAGLLTVAVLVVIGAGTRLPYSAEAAADAVVRLSWRARGARVEECRVLTAEEIEALPTHMRREEICEGRIASYRLRVALDGENVGRSVVRAAGARADRPLYVFGEYRLPPGRHTVDVVFERLDEGEAVTVADESGARPPVPDSLSLRRQLRLEAGQVALITYDDEARALVLRTDG